LKSLLIDIRDYLPKNHPIKELANLIAHPIRDKGISFDHLESFINDFLTVNKRGGKFNVNPVYKKMEIVEALIDSLRKLGFAINDVKIKERKEAIIEFISLLIEDTVIALKNKDILDARIIRSKGNLVFAFLVNPNVEGRIKFHSNVSICIPFWSDN